MLGVKIPMRDGVRLNATIYKPKDSEPVPAIFTLTPYIADSYHPRAYYFAKQGYAFALVDCRGRGNSEGDFEPFVNEEVDGTTIDRITPVDVVGLGSGVAAIVAGDYHICALMASGESNTGGIICLAK
jgi:hypothetical protein